MTKEALIIEFLKDLTDSQKVTLVYYCLGVKPKDIAIIRKVTKQAIYLHLAEIQRKKDHEELICDIQKAICTKGLFFDC